MNARFFVGALFALGMLYRPDVFASDSAPVQSRASYEAAIRNTSTAPSYVLISISDSDTGQPKPVCTMASFLLGAIHHEYGLGYDAAGSSKAVEIALKNEDHVFRFHQQAALDNIRVRYSDQDLAAARTLLAPLSKEELRTKFSSLYREARLPTDGYDKNAIACVLLERGLSPSMADRSGQVYVGRTE
jgi:hypothetical protein